MEDSTRVSGAYVTVKNGIPESSDPPAYLKAGFTSTIPGFYSFIKEREQAIRDTYENGNSSYSLKVNYNTEYHYPRSITFRFNGSLTTRWLITLMPLEEGDLEIDIGDYENQLEMWNNQNMLDYQIEVTYRQGRYDYNSPGWIETFNIKNGIPDVISSGYMKNKGTIPEIYSSVKEEEEMIRNVYNGINRSYYNVQYDTDLPPLMIP
jgi:hypothetical protein